MNNISFKNIQQAWSFGFFYLWGRGNEHTFLTNFTLTNVETDVEMFRLIYLQNIRMTDWQFNGVPLQDQEIFRANSIYGNFEMINFSVTGFNNTPASALPALSLGTSVDSTILLENFSIHDSFINNIAFLEPPSLFKELIINGMEITNTSFANEGALMRFVECGSLSINEVTVDNVNPISPDDSTASLFNILNLDYDHMEQISVSGIYITNSILSLLTIGTIQTTTMDSKMLTFDSVNYSNSVIPTRRSLISTGGFQSDIPMNIKFSNITFENIEFPIGGNLMSLSHQLPTIVEVTNSNFKSISSGLIEVVGNIVESSRSTAFKMSGCTFDSITSPLLPLITITTTATGEIQGSTFSHFDSVNPISGIIRVIESSQITFTDSIFQNNSAVVSPIFRVGTSSSLSWTNCTATNNFGITNGVFEVESNGELTFSQSNLFSNFAVQYLLGTIFNSVTPSFIMSTEIYLNQIITTTELATELTTCNHLCFLGPEVKEYLEALDFTTLVESEVLLSLLQSELTISDGTNIHDESLILSSFSATIDIRDSIITDINLTRAPLEAVTSTLIVSNLTVERANDVDPAADPSFIQSTTGIVQISDLKYSHSNSQVLQLLFSVGTIDNIVLNNITNSPELLFVISCDSFILSNIQLTDVSVAPESLVSIQNSNNVIVRDISLTNLDKLLISGVNNNITSIQNVNLTESKQVMKFQDSVITEMAD